MNVAVCNTGIDRLANQFRSAIITKSSPGGVKLPGKILSEILVLVYSAFLIDSLSGKRRGWVFDSVSSTNALVFNLAAINDLATIVIYAWLFLFNESQPFGRPIILALAHAAMSAAILGKYIGDEGQRWGCLGRPVCILFGLYWYYLAAGPGVMLGEIWDVIIEILDN
jgi:hypothetical protein